MKTLLSALIVAAASATATSAFASDRLPFGAPSEPTVFGHSVETTPAPVLQPLVTVRQIRPTASANGAAPSEPTIWGHRLPENRSYLGN